MLNLVSAGATVLVNCTFLQLDAGASLSLARAVASHSSWHAGFDHVRVGECMGGAGCVSLRLDKALADGSYTIAPITGGAGPFYTIKGGGEGGLVKGLWRFVRSLRVWRRRRLVGVPLGLRVSHSARDELWPMRGHQYSCAHHPSQFRTWEELTNYTLDLAAFGTNQVELAHLSAGAEAALPMGTLSNFSTMAAGVPGMGVSLWWASSLSSLHASELPAVFAAMPRLDSIFFPGGDGGSLNLTAIGLTLAAARGAHPEVKMWISLQELDAEAFASMLASLATPAWREAVHGVVYGPHERVPLAEFIRRIPSGYPVRQYPDIAHPAEAQYGLRAWSHVWSYTHRRFAVNPLPNFMGSIVRLRSGGTTPTVGVGGYSEGVNDDLNKAVWSQLALEPRRTVADVAAEYVGLFLGAEALEAGAAEALFALEANWEGDPLLPPAASLIPQTLAAWQRVEAAVGPAELSRSWRLQMYLRRAHSDAYQQARYACERAIEAGVLKAATEPKASSATSRIHAALDALAAGGTDRPGSCTPPLALVWRERILELSASIDALIGGEALLTQDPKLGLEWLETPLTDLRWLNSSLRAAASLPESGRAAALDAITRWDDAGPGGGYEALGAVGRRSHLVLPADGGASDPARYHTASIGGYAYNDSLRISSQRVAFSLYDANLTLRYPVEPSRRYRLTLRFHRPFHTVSPPTAPANFVRLVANGHTVLQPYALMPQGAVSYDVPAPLTAQGNLTLTCNMPPGGGGSGRGCGIAEVWLRPS